ncbi:hypothetical protein DL89DRAFT_321594 [Linderina pennispora]|uniref:SB domain-containing protein n=1 Tax=Linderina pennispora TaxID=61395 RepID=A0A1Y1WCD5_9FUNG|nr:uncharacterized protein DL89DRAFT_321594 [Linderina pennispora]ORX71197.1 hypothetical protein DL89DRAFT_321594 [Linderina pennispora]
MDDATRGLLCFHGTIPVPYHGAVFNIPSEVLVPAGVPDAPADFKAGKYVDDKCKIYHPYLASWSSESVTVELIAQLIKVFSPPSQTVMQPAKKPESAFVRPMSAVESELAGVTAAAASISVDSAQHGPGPIAQPSKAHPSYQPEPADSSSPRARMWSRKEIQSAARQGVRTRWLSSQRRHIPGVPTGSAASTPVVSQQAVQVASPVVPQQTVQPAAASPPRSSLLDTDPVDDPQKRLIGYQLAIFDRVFEAVKKSSEKHAKMNKELLDQSANLNSGAGVIAEERRQLTESQRQLEGNIRVLEAKVAELQAKKTAFPEPARVGDQLFDLAGEISAADDVLYYLGKSLDDGKLPLNIYMRQVRKLAQQQFMAKALANKIRSLCQLDA